MSQTPVRLPLFPLGSVLFPGQSLPLRVFEDRYVAMVTDLLAVEEPKDRLFASVAIREGYEVGSTGNQSLYRVGCAVQLTEATRTPGGFDVVGVVRERFRLDRLEAGGAYAVAEGVLLKESRGPDQNEVGLEAAARRALARFTRHHTTVSRWRGGEPLPHLPRDPEFLAWTLAGSLPLPLSERQRLLEADDTLARLDLVAEVLDDELRAMAAIPSLPATEIARTRWSPN